MNKKILIVDDEFSHRQMLETVLSGEGYDTGCAESGEQAVRMVSEKIFDLILMDIRMAGTGGIEALKKIRNAHPEIPVIMMTAYASVSTAVEALKTGAYDYLTKPLNMDEVKICIRQALRTKELEFENRYLKDRIKQRFDFQGIIGRSDVMHDLFEILSLAAPSEATVLICGESGTGKELIANAIHQNSSRRDNPFIKINCAALPDELLESELFGHEKGAFTGAVSTKKGRFQLAHTGSIFLDEIGEMSASTQAKILRVLQEQEFEPLGGTRTVRVDTRIIAATNRNLEAEIENGRFREDLFYRLNVLRLEVPPLRERGEDVIALADFFLKKYAEKNRRHIKGFSSDAVSLMTDYSWPGNVRELENLVERSVILSRGDMIRSDFFPKNMRITGDVPVHVKDSESYSPTTLKEMEKKMILRTLEETGGNRTHTANILGISRRTLQLKLKEYDSSSTRS